MFEARAGVEHGLVAPVADVVEDAADGRFDGAEVLVPAGLEGPNDRREPRIALSCELQHGRWT